jgi:glycosyltransferase involved in cell wall biosynthesis
MELLSIVSPCFNEEENVERCVEETLGALRDFDRNLNFEHIFIDNNSSDATLSKLKVLKNIHPHVRILSNSQNVGAFSSIQRGMNFAKGDWVVPFLAADCQDPPEMIAKMVALQRSTSCDSVFAIRETRAEGFLLLGMRKLFYGILKKLSRSSFRSGVSEFCLIQRKSSLKIVAIDDPNPFLRIYLNQLPGHVEYLPFHMKARASGKSSANMFSLIDDALNAFSLLLPSIYSRVLVFSAFTSAAGIASTFISLAYALLTRSHNFEITYLGVLITSLSGLFALIATIGHYVYIIHSQVRQKMLVETVEL